jgi:hypothetical protein
MAMFGHHALQGDEGAVEKDIHRLAQLPERGHRRLPLGREPHQRGFHAGLLPSFAHPLLVHLGIRHRDPFSDQDDGRP